MLKRNFDYKVSLVSRTLGLVLLALCCSQVSFANIDPDLADSKPIKASHITHLREHFNTKIAPCLGYVYINPTQDDAGNNIAAGQPIKARSIREVQDKLRTVYQHPSYGKSLVEGIKDSDLVNPGKDISASLIIKVYKAIEDVNFCGVLPVAACGTAHNTDRATAPSTPAEKCSVGTAGSISGTGPWTWTCTDPGPPVTTSPPCTARLGAAGVCGTANGQYPATAPSSNPALCNPGTFGSVSGDGSSANPWTWQCTGSVGGPASCSAMMGGSCGTADGGNAAPVTVAETCASGTASMVIGVGPWSWSCQGADNGSAADDDSCSASPSGCVSDAGCVSTPATPYCDIPTGTCVQCTAAAHCDDGVACTVDTCTPLKTCSNAAGNPGLTCRASTHAVCDPAEACTGVSTTCPTDRYAINGTGCGAGKECKDGACIDIASTCGNGNKESAEACDDGNTTTETACPYGTPTCTPCNATCTAELNLTGAYCGDGTPNGPETCDLGGQNGAKDGLGTPLNCCTTLCGLRPPGKACVSDGNACTDDVCNGSSDACQHTNNTAACDDTNACTHTDKCSAGSCGGTGYTCDSPPTCKTSAGASCNGDGTCTYTTNAVSGTDCEDGDLVGTCNDKCNGSGTCVGGSCGATGTWRFLYITEAGLGPECSPPNPTGRTCDLTGVVPPVIWCQYGSFDCHDVCEGLNCTWTCSTNQYECS